MAVVSRHPGLFDERTSAVARLLPEGEHLADGTKLYLRPSQQALGEGEIEQLRLWARRYLWIRDQTKMTEWDEYELPAISAWDYKPGPELNERHPNFDAAIDSAILAAAGGTK